MNVSEERQSAVFPVRCRYKGVASALITYGKIYSCTLFIMSSQVHLTVETGRQMLHLVYHTLDEFHRYWEMSK